MTATTMNRAPARVVLRFSLNELPPSVNNLYVTMVCKRKAIRVLSGHGRRFKAAGAKVVKASARRIITRAKNERYVLLLELYGLGYRRDVSNCIKVLEDCIFQTLGINDAYVDAPVALRCRADGPERVDVLLISYSGAPLTRAALGLILTEVG